MWLLLSQLALAGRWDGISADVVSRRSIATTAETLSNYLQDLHHFRDLFPEDCISQWVDGTVVQGPGASATLRYDIVAMHRKLTVLLHPGTPGVYVDFEHPGNKGFTTRFRFTPDGEKTSVEMNTGMNPPPWPLRGYYYKVVKPEWERCQDEALASLAKAVGA